MFFEITKMKQKIKKHLKIKETFKITKNSIFLPKKKIKKIINQKMLENERNREMKKLGNLKGFNKLKEKNFMKWEKS